MPPKDDHIQEILKSLPHVPGVYQYFNKAGEIIYVGKAKNLKKRVSSYFLKDRHESAKTQVLVKNIVDIKFIITNTEFDALLLENTLIKKHQPKYNINLKDDKTYPWIVVTSEAFPRIFATRKVFKDGSQYFGPYASVVAMRTLLEISRALFPTRTCRFQMSETSIAAGKHKICLDYHIGNCKGPCEGYQTAEEYKNSIEQIRKILRGNTVEVIQYLRDHIKVAAENLEFEKAHELKEKLIQIENFQAKSTVVSSIIHNVDVFSIIMEEHMAFINFMRVMNGAIVQSHTIELKLKIEESPAELLAFAIQDIRQSLSGSSNTKEIIVPFELDFEFPGLKITVPQLGDKRRLLDLSEKNARHFMKEKLDQYDKVDPEAKVNRLMERMKVDLRLTEQPRHIECFDNSNIQGSFAVAAMSVFKNGKASKKDYRHFNIKTVEGPDDFASMEEIIFRRYKRLLEEEQPLPQLIVIDGGKGQLGAALNSLNKLDLVGKVAIVSIAKKLEEIYYPGDSLPLYLDKKGDTLKIIQQLRDEVHRFGITFHRLKRSKGTIKTELEEIKGIGEKTAIDLLKHFKSVKRIKESSFDSLAAIAGPSKAQIIIDYFNAGNTIISEEE